MLAAIRAQLERFTHTAYQIVPYESVVTLAERINARAPNAMASVKELLAQADGNSLSTHLAQERDHFVRNLHHPNAGIGIQAFLDKQTPRYP